MWGIYSSQIQKGKQKKQKEAMLSGGKGVGGYRPTVNWREVSIRQRNIGDRQIIACIVVAGVALILIGVLVAILGFFVIATQCPFEWTNKGDLCFYFSSSNASFAAAHDYCTGFGSTSLTILKQDINSFISGKISGSSWIGLKCKDRAWRWTSSEDEKVSYTSWRSTPSACPAQKCAKMETSGDWATADCSDQLYFVCQFRPGYNPAVLIGPVLAFCGIIVLILSIEVCYRRREFVARNPEVMDKDDEDDHKIDEGIINYGYGHFGETKSPATVKQAPASKSLAGSSPWHSKNKTGPELIVQSSSATTSPKKLTVPQPEEQTPSQEQLELLLSPKNL